MEVSVLKYPDIIAKRNAVLSLYFLYVVCDRNQILRQNDIKFTNVYVRPY